MPRKNRTKFHLIDYIFLTVIFITIVALSFFLWTQLIPLWTMKINTKAYDITTFKKNPATLMETRDSSKSEQPLRVEIITDFDRLSISKLAFDRVLTLTLKEKPDIIVFFSKTGESGRAQKKLQSMFYLISRFQLNPERIFVIPDRAFYEYLIGNTKVLIYYVDFFKSFNAEVEFEGIENIGDSLTFIMASSRDRIEFLKGVLGGTVVLLADDPKEKVNEIIPEIFITSKKPSLLKNNIPPNLLIVRKGVTFLNLY